MIVFAILGIIYVLACALDKSDDPPDPDGGWMDWDGIKIKD